VLELNGLTSGAGSFTIHPVSLKVEQGESHVILGPTGSGKTLLLETILGLRHIDAGRIELAGVDITSEPVEKRGIGYVPQDLALFPHLNVLDNILYGSRIRNGEDIQQDQFINELTQAVRIEHLLERMPDKLSGGEKQRVALVRAIASGCKVLLLDEPFSSVNESLRKDLWLMINALQKRFGLTLLLITHDLEEAFFLSDTMSIFINGRMQQSSAKRDVYQQPATRDVARFFGIKNLYKGVLEHGVVTAAELGMELAIDSTLHQAIAGRKVMVGIRANEVMILRDDADPTRWENTVSGQVRAILDKGAAYTVLFTPDTAPHATIEIELNSHAYRRLNINEGKKLSVSLKKENLFLIADH
jgi:ABC-type Fe3+/spermidine/putrescine transport system ATPase subunit